MKNYGEEGWSYLFVETNKWKAKKKDKNFFFKTAKSPPYLKLKKRKNNQLI